MAKYISYVLFLIWFSYLLVSSILLFINGFLLTRVTQHINATCAPYSEATCLGGDSITVGITNGHELQCSGDRRLNAVLDDFTGASGVCLPPRSKVILMVIDALKHDFTVTDPRIRKPLPYKNKLPVMSKLLKESPTQTRLYKFIADPPTTTMQRLKALTTGSLPTFIDAGSNFATSEINEDNVIDQLVRYNKSVVFMGDDTWTGLYPKRFSRSFPFPSFNVFDLDTVDTGVIKHLYPEIGRPDWNLLIAHFLGVDHCGHKHGPNHPEMARKLTEMNEVIENIVDLMDDQTVLYVIGDHGMTSTGDHGGESVDEVTAAMFVHSKKPLLSIVADKDEVKQVDIVPTLAITLGIPIPFSNLGSIMLNTLPVMEEHSTDVPEWKVALFSLWANAQQLVRYIKQYSETAGTFSEENLKALYERFSLLNSRIRSVTDEKHFKVFAEEVGGFLVDVRTMCEQVWVQFDPFSMSRGLLFLFMTLFLVYVIVDGIPSIRLPEIFRSSFLPFSYGAMFLSAIFTCVLYYFEVVDNLLHSVLFATCLISQFILAILIVQNWEVITLNWYDRSKKNRLVNAVCRITLGFTVLASFSNSYIIEEGLVLLFCLVTVVFIGTLEVGNDEARPSETERGFALKWPKIKYLVMAFGIACLVRFSMFYWRCREEQQLCLSSAHNTNSSHKMKGSQLQCISSCVAISLIVVATKKWLKNSGNLNGSSITVLLARYTPTVIVVCTTCYWLWSHQAGQSNNNTGKTWQATMFAWTVYALSAIGITSVIFRPLCIYIKPNIWSTDEGGSLIPILFHCLRSMFKGGRETGDKSVPTIYGLGTVYGSAFLIIGVYMTLVISLLLGAAGAISATVMFTTAACILIASSIMRIERAQTLNDLFEVPNVLLVTWVLLSQYFFYGTGHQPTFTNIPWEAAFVGVPGTFTHNFIPATLVIIHTFSSHILVGFLLPLLLTSPFMVLLVLPSWISRWNLLLKNPPRGEISLYESDSYSVSVVFSLCCKYILCHGFRVFASMLAATIHCRHLMVWKIFAPKLIFESVGMLVTLAVVTIAFLVMIRVNSKLDSFLLALNRQAS